MKERLNLLSDGFSRKLSFIHTHVQPYKHCYYTDESEAWGREQICQFLLLPTFLRGLQKLLFCISLIKRKE